MKPVKRTILAFAVALVLTKNLSAQTFTLLHTFAGSDGSNPNASLILAGNTLFGTTVGGGISNMGSVFSVNTGGTNFSTLHNFIGGIGGAIPNGAVILSGKTLYGTAYYGGSSGNGLVFSVNIDGTNFTTVHDFNGGDGANPSADLIISGNTLYGTAFSGGSRGGGTVFKVNTDGSGFTNLYSFTGSSDGSVPRGLILAGSIFYGATGGGGAFNFGTIFKINIDGMDFTNLADIPTSEGGCNGLILLGNTLYGTTGSSFYNSYFQAGTVFAINTDGTGFTNLYRFTGGSDGSDPFDGPILSGNKLYGTAYAGGSSNAGAVFAINIDGTGFTNLYSFTGGSNGANPYASLILSGNILYGTASGGSSGKGIVFALSLAPSPPIITTQPQSQITQAGSNITFSVVANGLPSPNYQWQFNGQSLSGQTTTSLLFTNVQFANAGSYSVIITNTSGSVTSSIAQLTVFTNLLVVQTNKPPPPPGSPTIPTDATHFKVFTNGSFVSGIGLDRTKGTIILTHGYKESSLGLTDWPQEMANFIKLELGSSTPNIVAWDWTTQAAEPLPTATLDTQGQGYALGENLTNALGANYSQRIHFIGHSLGTLVNARAANFIHTNGFSWSNTQMTLCDDAEVAWGLVGNSWATLTSLLQNDSSPQQDWIHPLPDQCAWADNYITAVGIPHSQAVNVILTNLTPDVSNIQNLFDIAIGAWTGLFKTEITDFHDYSYIWYENTVSQINNPNDPPYLMGFIRSWEGGGYASRPSANTYYIESKNCPPSFPSYSGYDPAYNLVQITPDQANQYLNARPQNLISQVGVNVISSSANVLANNINQQVQILNGPAGSFSSLITGANNDVNYVAAIGVKLITTSLVNGLVHPLGGPMPMGGSGGNSPAYVWIPVTVPSNALTMSFNFMLQGNGNQDSFQVAMNSNNLMTVETVLFQTNVTMNSGMIDVSQYAGQQAELFFGIVGGTSTNASVTVSDIAFYVTLPPSLQIQMAGTNVVLSWSLWAANYSLETTAMLGMTNSWKVVTNVTSIVNSQCVVTNQISSGSRFYRLAIITAPTLQEQVSGKNFILSWLPSAQNFSLQTTTNIADPNSWTTLTNVPAIVNLQNTITNPIVGSQGFYRLIQSQ
jgi:uncharacterized repeat protein (TIGR03803 family)